MATKFTKDELRAIRDNKGSNDVVLSEEAKQYKRKMNDGD